MSKHPLGYSHLHRDGYRAYAVHDPDGKLIGYVRNIVKGTLQSDAPGVSCIGWVAYDENRKILTDGLESRDRAWEWVAER
jgi:hypothetical protein